MPATASRPATFDASSAQRRSMLGKVHIAKLQLGMVDDDYRQLLMDSAGVTSAADCNVGQLHRVLRAMEAKGFKPTIAGDGKRPTRRGRAANSPMANKARALWISLYHLGAIDNPAEPALEAFAKRQLKVDRMAWADEGKAYKLIEALKAIAERHGWCQSDDRGHPLTPTQLQFFLVAALVTKLKAKGLIPINWTSKEAAFRLLGETHPMPFQAWSVEILTRIAQGLGAKLREAGLAS